MIGTRRLDGFWRNILVTHKSAYLAKLSSCPAVKPNDGTGLQEFCIVLEQARNAMTDMQYMNDLNMANVIRQLWEKLPQYLRSKWT